jgi:hypothetical protein
MTSDPLVVTDGRRPLHTLHQEHALLLESQWGVPLPEVLEAAPCAAPDKLMVYYSDMVPFAGTLTTLAPRCRGHGSPTTSAPS